MQRQQWSASTILAASMSLRLTLITIVTLSLCCVTRAHAQSNGTGRIEGIAYDSVHAQPLAGAHVVAAGTAAGAEVRRDAMSDSAGRYRIDSLPGGHYLVGFESALLDSLEVTLSPRETNLTSGQVARVDLALPSAAKLRSAVCFGATLPPETGVIIGHVVSAETESPLAGVTIAMEWRDLGVDRKTLRPINRQRSDSVITDRDGWYRMCGVPTGTWVSMQIQHDNRSGAVLRTRVDDTLGIAIRHLSLAAAPSRASETTSSGRSSVTKSGTATLSGVVRSLEGVPVALAEVRVRDTGIEGRTDALGAFTLRGLPAGTQQLEVRHVGYAVVEVPVDLRSGVATAHDVLMRRIVNLDSVVVVASRPKYPDFYAHKSSGFGRFLGPEDIAKQRVVRTADIIEKMPGFTVEKRGYHSVVMGVSPEQLGDCRSVIVIDGNVVPPNSLSIDDIHPAEVGAIEVYSSSERFMAPPEYHIGACGGVVIWTKR
jgi:hypothetical protein